MFLKTDISNHPAYDRTDDFIKLYDIPFSSLIGQDRGKIRRHAFEGWPIEEAEGRGSASRRGDDRSLEGISSVGNAAACDSGDNGRRNGEEI